MLPSRQLKVRSTASPKHVPPPVDLTLNLNMPRSACSLLLPSPPAAHPSPQRTLLDSSATPMGPSPPTRFRMHRCMAEAVEPRPAGDTSRTITAAGARQHSLRGGGVGGWVVWVNWAR